jgi:hypothetical protein
MTDLLAKTIGWCLEKIFQLIILYIWLAFWLASAIAKLAMLAFSGGKADVRVIGWNHRKAAQSFLGQGEAARYVGPGGLFHHYMKNYMSTVAYIYLTEFAGRPYRVLVVSKNRGCHEFPYGIMSLDADAGGGHLSLLSPVDEVHLGFVSGEAIREINEARHLALTA